MRDYVDFGTCTAQALDHTAATTGTRLTDEQRDDLLATYRRLPAFPDVAPALERLAADGRRLVAFSNGPVVVAHELLGAADLRSHLHDVVSTDEIRAFKPDPAVHRHLPERVATVAGLVVVASSRPSTCSGPRRRACGPRGYAVRTTALLNSWGESSPTPRSPTSGSPLAADHQPRATETSRP